MLDDLDVDGLSRRFLQAWMGHAEAPKKSRVENRGVGFLDTLASRRLGGEVVELWGSGTDLYQLGSSSRIGQEPGV